MDIPTLIAHYGLLAVFIGCLLEGETVLLLAGYAAHRGYLDMPAVLAVAWSGAVLGDQFYFWLGRRHGTGLMQRFSLLGARVKRGLALIDQHPVKTIFAMRFTWGLRTALPIAIGMSRVTTASFFSLNLVSAVVWTLLISSLGWAFGAVLARHVDDLRHAEQWVVLAVVLAALVAHGVSRRLERKRS